MRLFTKFFSNAYVCPVVISDAKLLNIACLRMHRFQNLLRLIALSLKVYQANRETGSYHALVRRKAAALIEQSRLFNQPTTAASLNERMFLKIQWYMVTHLFTGELFAQLSGEKLSEDAQMRYICLGAVCGLADILIDDYKFSIEKIETLLQIKEPGLAETPVEKVILHYYYAMLRYLPPQLQEGVNRIFVQSQQAQADSLRQFDPSMPPEEVEKVVMKKGGIIVLLCRAVLSPMAAQEEAAFYQLGGLIQKMNDCVDLYKDGKEGILTSANIFSSVEEMKMSLEKQKNITFRLIGKLPYKKKGITNFLFVFHVFLVSVFFKLEEYSRKCGGKFNYQQFLELPKEKARSQPFSLRSLQYCFFKILNFRWN
jgi:hypothetical protein